jgi:hypothetical protein
MTGTRHPMRRLLPVPLLLVTLAGCGGAKDAAEAPKATPMPTVTPDPAAGSFPDRPQVIETFSKPGSGWPRDGYRDGAFLLPARGSAAVLAPRRVDPATRGTLSEVAVRVPKRGAAGLLCRASASGGTGYGLLLDAHAKVQLLRLDHGKVTVIKQHRLSPNERSDRGKPTLLRLGCGTGTPGKPLTLIYAVNATPYGYVTDQDSIDPGRTARVGLLARDGVAQFDSFALYLAN